MERPELWVSITDAAQRLTALGRPIDRSTLSRYIAQHGEALPTRRDGRATLVEFHALCAHRGENIRVTDAAPAAVEPAASAAGLRGRETKRFGGSQVDGAARKAMAQAEMAELDLAERRQQLAPTAEVEQAGHDAIALMNASFERAIETEADKVSARYGWDTRIVRSVLKRFARVGTEAFHREMLSRVDDLRRREEAARRSPDAPDTPTGLSLQ